jgi:phosphoribosylformylglycinamidine cyclo-ligase
MEMRTGATYRESGVDTVKAAEAVEEIKKLAASTFDKNVLGGIGGFGSLYQLPMEGIKQPVLVSGTDGVGTKLKIAFLMNRHNTVGIDCVAMCVNDVLCQGARPLFFLDYIACGKLDPRRIRDIVGGISEGCLQGEAALIGGETAEMPGFYPEEEYDLAGFCVGMVDKEAVINGAAIKEGDVLIGLSSSGVHSNGFSLIRKILVENIPGGLEQRVEELGCTLGEELLKPTRIYTKPVKRALGVGGIKGMVHITGGGFYENIPRILPLGTGVEIVEDSWKIPPIFSYIQACGKVERREMFSTFNMGVGYIFVVSPESKDPIIAALKEAGEVPFVMGLVVKGEGVMFV